MQSNTINEQATSKRNKVGHDITLILLRIKEARDSVSGWLKRWLADQFDSSLSSRPNTVDLKRS